MNDLIYLLFIISRIFLCLISYRRLWKQLAMKLTDFSSYFIRGILHSRGAFLFLVTVLVGDIWRLFYVVLECEIKYFSKWNDKLDLYIHSLDKLVVNHKLIQYLIGLRKICSLHQRFKLRSQSWFAAHYNALVSWGCYNFACVYHTNEHL